MKPLRVLSLFDGISCGQVALERAGIPVEVYYASEIDKYAIQITQKNYPNTIQLGDVTTIDFTDFVGKVDLLIGGSPCQSLSITQSKTRQNLDGNGRCFCNPPFSKKADFIKKADKEVKLGICPICVMILPLNCMDTKIWHEVIEGRYHYEILKGRIAFIDPETKKPKKGNNSGTVIVYFKKRIEI